MLPINLCYTSFQLGIVISLPATDEHLASWDVMESLRSYHSIAPIKLDMLS